MRKLFTIALIGILLCSLVACAPVLPDDNYRYEPAGLVGKWKCNDMNQLAGVMFDFADGLSGLDVFGTLGDAVDISVELTFFQNGTYQLDMAVMMLIVGTETETMTGTYSWQNNQLILDGEIVDATLNGNKLTLSSHTPDGYVVRLEFERDDRYI